MTMYAITRYHDLFLTQDSDFKGVHRGFVTSSVWYVRSLRRAGRGRHARLYPRAPSRVNYYPEGRLISRSQKDLSSFVCDGNEGTELCNQQSLVLEIGLYDETMMRINPKGLRRQLDLKVPERPLQLRVSIPDRKEKKSTTIMYRENTTSTRTT